MTPTYKKIHLKFKLNGHNFTREELREVAYSFVKEGRPYERSVGDFLMDWIDGKTYIDVKTSGSTSNPKTIRLKKQHMVNSALSSGDFFGITVGDRALHCLPANFIAGKMMLVRAMILGLEIDLVEPGAFPMQQTEANYDFAAMTPMQLGNSLKDLHRIKKLIVGGAPVSAGLIESLQSVSTAVFETYGMTETVTHVAARQLNRFNNVSEVEGSYFRVLPSVQISTDERGCLVIDAPHIAQATLVTNDLVDLKGDSEFEWLGRVDNVINSGGIKLIPELLEEKFIPVMKDRFFLIGLADEVLGQKLVMVVENAEGEQESYFKLFRDITGLDKYEIPKEILFTKKFEETENGKVKRKATLKKIN